jgi:hypothetical protein
VRTIHHLSSSDLGKCACESRGAPKLQAYPIVKPWEQLPIHTPYVVLYVQPVGSGVRCNGIIVGGHTPRSLFSLNVAAVVSASNTYVQYSSLANLLLGMLKHRRSGCICTLYVQALPDRRRVVTYFIVVGVLLSPPCAVKTRPAELR